MRASPRAALQWMLGRGGHLDADDLADLARLRALAPVSARRRAADTATLMVASFLPLPYCLKVEGLMACAMRSRGYRVVVVCNDKTAHLVRAYHGGVFGFEVIVLEDYLGAADTTAAATALRELGDAPAAPVVKAFRHRGIPVGLHALATYLAAAPQGFVPAGVGRLLRTVRHSMLLVDACAALMDAVRPDMVLAVEKGFVGTAEMFHCAVKRGVDYVQWVGCHEPDSVMLKRYRADNVREHPFSISDRSWGRIKESGFDPRLRDDVMREFSRGYDSGAWFRYKNLSTGHSRTEPDRLRARLGLDPSKKTAVIYSHILNDANLFYGEDLFAGGFEQWLVETVAAASRNREVNWVLKLHPANLFRNARLGYSGEFGELLALKRAFGEVPKFLVVVTPDEKASPLDFFQITDVGLTVRGTVGLELPCFGIPVLTAGTGRYAGRGFTVDSGDVSEYLAKVAAIQEVPALSDRQVDLAQMYAYNVFRRRPAKYDAIAEDMYDHPVKHPRHRDLRIKAASLDEALGHPQLQRIAAFLADGAAEDFFSPAPSGAL